MSYTPTQWQTGDTITAAGLNNMENGIENASEPFIVTLTPTAQDFSGTIDKQPSEIRAAYDEGRRIRFVVPTMSAVVEMSACTLYDNLKDGKGNYYNSIAAAAIFWFDVGDQDVLINILTDPTDQAEPSEPYYTTKIFPLTPMS